MSDRDIGQSEMYEEAKSAVSMAYHSGVVRLFEMIAIDLHNDDAEKGMTDAAERFGQGLKRLGRARAAAMSAVEKINPTVATTE